MTVSEIKKIQKELNIPLTGKYDSFTKAAVKNFQQKNKLPATGIFDNSTKELLLKDSTEGLLTTDLSENKHIINRYLLKPEEYYTTNENKEWLFLHHTAGWNNPFAVVDAWEADTRGKIGTEYIVGGRHIQTLDAKYDGQIVQCFPSHKNYAWHLGIGNTKVHRASIGIEVCNFGWLVKDGNDFKTYISLDNTGKIVKGRGPIVNPSEVCDLGKEFRGFRYYHKYTDAQLSSLKYLITKIANETGIDITKGLKERIRRSTDPFAAFDFDPNVVAGKVKGLYCHTNVSARNKYGGFDKWDITPQQGVIDMILSL
jgi:N-acetyl-anhydromuramyl-L-alanine amidase AmpD